MEQYSTDSDLLAVLSADSAPHSPHSAIDGEIFMALASPSLEIVFAAPPLATALGVPPEALTGLRLADALPDRRARELLGLLAKRVVPEMVVPWPGTEGLMELVIRPSLSGDRIWPMLHARRAGATPRRRRPEILGRARELAEFERFLADDNARVLYLHGPLGIGKSALLAGFAGSCDELGCQHFAIDARLPSSRDALEAHAAVDRRGNALLFTRHVVLVDGVDAWRDVELPAVIRNPPEGWRVVVSSRSLPGPAWRALAAIRMLALAPLAAEAAVALAVRSGAPRTEARALVRRSQGHPGSIVELARGGRSPQIDAAHLETELAMPPGTLEPAAVPARITEDVLVALLGDAAIAKQSFHALRALCSSAEEGTGMQMPLAIRSGVLAGLQQRSPRHLTVLHARLVAHYCELIESAAFAHDPAAIVDDFFDAFSGSHPVARLAGDRGDDPLSVRLATAADHDAVVELARTLGSSERAREVRRRLDAPGVVTTVVEREGRVVGIGQSVIVSAANASTLSALGDEAITAAVEAARRTGVLASADRVTAVLATISEDTHARVWGPVSRASFRAWVRGVLTARRLGATLFVGRPEDLANFPPFPLGTSTLVIGELRVIVRNLQRRGRRALLEAIAASDAEATPAAAISAELVRDALAAVDDPAQLLASPLTALRLVKTTAGAGAAPVECASLLGALLRDAVRAVDPGIDFAQLSQVLETRADLVDRVTERLFESETRAESAIADGYDRSDGGDDIARELQIAAIPARVTEDVLAALLDDPGRASALYRVIESLGRPDESGPGLRLTEDLRRALVARFRSRSPARYGALRLRLAGCYGAMLDAGMPRDVFPVLDDFLETFADHPRLVELCGAGSDSSVRLRQAGAADRAALVRAASALGGPDEARAIEARLDAPAIETWIAERAGAVVGLVQYGLYDPRQLDALLRQRSDAALAAAAMIARERGPLPEGARVFVEPASFADEGADEWGPISQQLKRQSLAGFLYEPGIALLLQVRPAGETRLQPFPLRRLAELLSANGRPVILRDLRGQTREGLFQAFLTHPDGDVLAPAPPPPRQITSAAVRTALASMRDPLRLATSPLCELAIVARERGGSSASAEARARALATLLRREVRAIGAGGGEAEVRAVMEQAFLDGDRKHEAIAHDLGMSYATFRRRLTRGIELVTEALRHLEGEVAGRH